MTNREKMNQEQLEAAMRYPKRTNISIAERRVDQFVKFFDSSKPDEWYAYDVSDATFPTKEEAIKAEIAWLESETRDNNA